MPAESITYLAAVAIICSVIVKILTTNSIAAQRRELTQLQRSRAAVNLQLQSVVEQRTSATDLIEFYESRKAETDRRITEESVELELLEAAERRYLESLGYDEAAIEQALELGGLSEIVDETQTMVAVGEEGAGDVVTAVDGEEEPEAEPGEMGDPAGTFRRADAAIEAGAPVAVIPATLRDPNKLFLPDALVTELLGKGVNVVDRFTLGQQVEEAGEDLESILTGEHYSRLGTAADLGALVIVNSLLLGSGVGSATCRVVELPTGKILLSTSYEQPGETERSPDFEPLTRTAQVIIEAIGPVFGTDAGVDAG